ncbi:MAG: hypothetical protein LBS21_10785 [Clostridiales bacterium]|jgi:hypothetical protein|nr:hypothetical protein [Clostridiales bacterium]
MKLIKYNATGHNFNKGDTDKLSFGKRNMKSILESDIAYISGHGYYGGVLPISAINSGFENSGLLVANYSVMANQTGFLPTRENSFSFKVSENEGVVSARLKWLIFAACSTLNDGPYRDRTDEEVKFDDKYTVEHWIDTLISNPKMKGILGYYGTAPLANATRSDNDVISRFLNYSKDEQSIYDSWVRANAYRSGPFWYIDDSRECALLSKDSYAHESLKLS